jgi:hypothetical protein
MEFESPGTKGMFIVELESNALSEDERKGFGCKELCIRTRVSYRDY